MLWNLVVSRIIECGMPGARSSIYDLRTWPLLATSAGGKETPDYEPSYGLQLPQPA